MAVKLEKITRVFDPEMNKKYLVETKDGSVFVSSLLGFNPTILSMSPSAVGFLKSKGAADVDLMDTYVDDVAGKRIYYLWEIKNLYEIKKDK